MHPVSGSAQVDQPSRSVVAVIPARYASTRLPAKALADIAGRPMIEHVYRRAAAARSLASVLVATDDERIVRAVEAFGGVARMTSASHVSGTDRVAEAVASLPCDIVVNIQGDLPLIAPAAIEQAIAPLLADPSIVMSTLRRKLTDAQDVTNPNVVKVVVDADGFALYFSRAPIPFHRDSARRDARERLASTYKHIGLYVYRKDFLLSFARLEATPLERAESLEQLRALEHGYRIKTVETIHDSIEIDTPEDLERVRRLVTVDPAILSASPTPTRWKTRVGDPGRSAAEPTLSAARSAAKPTMRHGHTR